MNVLDAIEARSYRGKFKLVPVPRDDLVKIMKAGLDALSGCNKQTVSIIVIDDSAVLKKLLGVIEPPECDMTVERIVLMKSEFAGGKMIYTESTRKEKKTI